MELQNVLTELESKFGNKFDTTKVTELLKNVDLKNLSFDEIVAKVKSSGLVGDLDGDGKEEGLFEELKGKAGEVFSGFFHK